MGRKVRGEGRKGKENLGFTSKEMVGKLNEEIKASRVEMY